MLGRRDSEEGRHPISSSSSSSSSSPPATPTDPLPRPMRPAALRNQRSMRSESFKALLLRKGSRSDSCSRISAVERLRKAAPPMTTGPDHQRSLSLPQRPDQPHVRPTSLSHTTDTHDINAHMTLDIPASPPTPCSHNLSVMLGLRQRDLTHSHLLFTSSPSPFFFLPSSSSMRPRSLTPPCSGSRRLAARCRLYATPMTAIFEGEGEEEEEDDEVFVESPGSLLGTEAELGQRLVEIS